MDVKQSDLLFYAGGECFEKYGLPFRRTTIRERGGEDMGMAFTRADASTVASYIDRDGYVRRALANVLRVDYPLVNGVRQAHTLHEASRTNLVTWSDALSNWSSFGTPTVTDAAVSSGGLDLTLLGDDDGAAVEGKFLTLTFTGADVKALSFALKAGTILAVDGSQIRLQDTTAAASRLDFTVTWSGGVPTIIVATGTQLGTAELLRDGIYIVRFQSTSVTPANAHQIEVYPAKTLAQTGNIYVGGVLAANATFPSSLIKTTGATKTRAADRLEFAFNAEPQAMTIYADFIERAQPNWLAVVGEHPIIAVIGSSGFGVPYLALHKLTGGDSYRLQHSEVANNVTAVLDVNPVLGDRIELRAVLNADGSVQLGVAKTGGAESVSGVSGALALAAAWSSPPLVSLGSIGANGQADINLRAAKIAAGVFSMAEMRAAAA